MIYFFSIHLCLEVHFTYFHLDLLSRKLFKQVGVDEQNNNSDLSALPNHSDCCSGRIREWRACIFGG
jgi:hypothetical protein